MRFFSLLISIHGLAVIYNSVIQVYSAEYFKFGHLIFDSQYYYIGLLIGALLIYSGIGMYFKRKSGYYTTLFTYTIYILYSFVSLIYIFATDDGIELVPTMLIFILIIAFYLLIRYINSNRNWFNL